MKMQNKPLAVCQLSLIISVLLTALAVYAQTPPTVLELAKPVERQIKGGETHSFQLRVKAGHYARVEVEQKNIDVVVSLFASGGELVVEMDGEDGRLWREVVSCIAPRESDYRVAIRAHGPSAATGSYTVSLAELRVSVPDDRKRLSAESQFSAFLKSSESGTEEPLKGLEESARLRREVGDTEWEAISLLFLTWAKLGLPSKRDEAIRQVTIAQELFQRTKDRVGEGKSFELRGTLHKRSRELDKASDSHEKALRIWREIGDRRGELRALHELAFTFLTEPKQPEKAFNCLERILSLIEGIDNYETKIEFLISAGIAYRILDHHEKAAQTFDRALSESRRAKDRRAEMSVLEGISFGGSENASSNLEKALAIASELKDSSKEAEILAILALEYRMRGELNKSLPALERALSIRRSRHERAEALELLIKLGDLYFELFNYEKAQEYFETALLLQRELRLPLSDLDAFRFRDIAAAYRKLKLYTKALDLYEKALAYFKDDRPASFANRLILTEIAELFREQKLYDKAAVYLEKALRAARASNDHLQEKFALIALGNLFQEQKKFGRALDHYRKSLEVHATFLEYPDFEGPLNIGKLYLELKEYGRARSYLDRAYAISQQPDFIGRRYEEIMAAMVELHLGLKEPDSAILFGKQEVNRYQNVRNEIKDFDRTTQEKFVENKEPAYRKLAGILISVGRFLEAQSVLDLLKGQEYKQLITRQSGDPSEVVPYNKAEAEVISKIENLAALGRRQSELRKEKEQLGDKFPLVNQKELDKTFVDLEIATKAFRESLNALARSEANVRERVAEIKEEWSLQRSLNQLSKEHGASLVALYTIIGTDDANDSNGKGEIAPKRSKFGWVILVTPEGRKAYPIDVRDLEQNVFQFRNALGNDKYDPRPIAQRIYKALFRQTSERQKQTLEADLKRYFGTHQDKTLMWSLDGVLRYVPMAALHDGEQYLIEKYSHIVFTKQSLLHLNERDSERWKALGLGVSEQRDHFAPLPGAEKELKEVVREPQALTGIFEGSIRLNNKFKKDETISLWRDGKYPVVHIASHYSFNPLDQTASFLLVGDGKLTFADIQDKDNLFGTVDLLTLSACDTATSGNGKEAEGFAYLAQSLGAKSVLASLWKISDAATPELMVRFYKLKAGNPTITKGEAFRRAQLSLLHPDLASGNPAQFGPRSEIFNVNGKVDLPLFVKDNNAPFSHPHYWSSFVLIGNWR